MNNLREALLAAVAVLALAAPLAGQGQARISDLTIHQGEVPRRIVGYGLVVGLDGTGDRSFGTNAGAVATVRSVVNLLRRFNVEVPAERLRLRDVAAVLVTAEVSPYLRAGGKFEVQVAALGDATSLRGGMLWITPMVTDPGAPPVGTAQGILITADQAGRGGYGSRTNSGRIPDGGVIEVEPPAQELQPHLVLKSPSLATARNIAEAINTSLGGGIAKVTDAGLVTLTPATAWGDTASLVLAAIDTLPVSFRLPARVIINAREGTVVAGGEVTVGNAVVSHRGITLQIGGSAPADSTRPGDTYLRVEPRASVQDIAGGLRVIGARSDEIAAIFEALRAAGSLTAEVVIR